MIACACVQRTDSDYNKRLNDFKLIVYKDGVQVHDSGLIKPNFASDALNGAKANGFWSNGAYKNLFKSAACYSPCNCPQLMASNFLRRYSIPNGVEGDKVKIIKPNGGILGFGELEVLGTYEKASTSGRLDTADQLLDLQGDEAGLELEAAIDEFEEAEGAEPWQDLAVEACTCSCPDALPGLDA
eukprot:tig00020904_g15284.t1